MTLLFERAWPYAAALVWTLAWWKLLEATFPASPSGLLAASVTAAAVVVGFLATANAIVFGLSDTDLFKRLRNAGYLNLIHNYFFEATAASLAFLVVSIAGFFLKEASVTQGAFPVVWMVTGSCSLALFARVAHLFFKLLRRA